MATVFLRSTDGNDSDDGLSWANAKARIKSACVTAGNGGTVYVSQNHYEIYTGVLTICPAIGLPSNPLKIFCVDDTLASPTGLTTGATVITTGAGSNHINLASGAFVYINGLRFIAGSSNGSQANISICEGDLSPSWSKLENCNCELASTSTSSRIGQTAITASMDDSLLEFENVTTKYNNTSLGISLKGDFVWTNTSNPIIGNVIPQFLFWPSNGAPYGVASIKNLDFSSLSASALIPADTYCSNRFIFTNCKFPNSMIIGNNNPVGQGGISITCINCDSSGVNYQYYTKKYQGEIFDDNSVITVDGSTISRKMISSTGATLYSTLDCDPLVVYNTLTGYPLNAAVEIINSGVTLRNDEIWLEVEYPSSSVNTLYSKVSDGKTHILAQSGIQTLSTTLWLNTGEFSSPVRQTLDVDFTPMMTGLIYCTVKLAKPSTIVYFDRKIRMTVI